MANIWQETLDLEDVGVYDNFFELVRDSYLAMEVIKRVREVFKVALSVRALFADPTVAGMTAAVLQQKAKWTNSPDSTEGISTLNLQKKTATRTTPATKY
jgi:spore germination protein GerM